MKKRTVTLVAMKKERDNEKVRRVIVQKGYSSGKLPNGKHLHHVIPVASGGKTTVRNTRVVTAAKHRAIHKGRAQKGLI